MRTRMGASRKFERAFKRSQSSPFRLRLRIGPRPAFHGGGATVKVEGAAPFVEPERRLSGPDFHARFSAELVPFLLRVTISLQGSMRDAGCEVGASCLVRCTKNK